jgi:hypothetical protein
MIHMQLHEADAAPVKHGSHISATPATETLTTICGTKMFIQELPP